jgi:hypothetical protein
VCIKSEGLVYISMTRKLIGSGASPWCIIVIALCLLVTCASAVNVISAEPSSVSVQPGSTTDAKVIVDELPNGISGYALKVTLTDSSVAKIVNVTFPSWAILSNTTQLTPGSVKVSGIDLNKAVQPGSMNVLLATITVEGITSGTTPVVISNVTMDDGNGTDVNAPPVTMVAAVSGNANSGGESYSGGGGSGGSGGISSGGSTSSGAAGSVTATVTGTTTTVSAVSTPVDNKPNSKPNQAPAATVATLVSGQQASSAGSSAPSANTAIPGNISGSMVIIAIIIAIIAAAGLLYFTHQKKL